MRYLVAICLCIYSFKATAQDITGTWEEHSETRFTSYTKLSIVKICDSYIGFSFDRDNDGGHCKADFFSTYNKKRQVLRGETTAFMEHTYGHVLALYTLYYIKENGVEFLEGTVYQKPDTIYQLIEGIPRMRIIEDPSPEFIRLRKTGQVTDSTAYMRLMASKPCKNQPEPVVTIPNKDVTPDVVITPVSEQKIVEKPVVVITPVKEEKTIDKPVTDPPIVVDPAIAILQMRDKRVNDTLSVISTTEKELVVRVVDNAITDGDTISIVHNGILIAERILVSAKPYPIKISLSKENPYHELVLIAHNLGSIPPNTALLLISYGNKEYRLYAIADLSKNALIIFKYTGQ